jgi:hypothetical protein
VIGGCLCLHPVATRLKANPKASHPVDLKAFMLGITWAASAK